jgi:hypothetical protein
MTVLLRFTRNDCEYFEIIGFWWAISGLIFEIDASDFEIKGVVFFEINGFWEAAE